MNLKTRLVKLEAIHSAPIADDESLSPQERYLWMLKAPMPTKVMKGRSRAPLSPEDAHWIMLGKMSGK